MLYSWLDYWSDNNYSGKDNNESTGIVETTTSLGEGTPGLLETTTSLGEGTPGILETND